MNMETQLEIEQADVQAPSDQMQDQTGDNSNKKSITHVLLI